MTVVASLPPASSSTTAATVSSSVTTTSASTTTSAPTTLFSAAESGQRIIDLAPRFAELVPGWELDVVPPIAAPVPSGLADWQRYGGVRCDGTNAFDWTTGAGYEVDMLLTFYPPGRVQVPIPNYRIRKYKSNRQLAWESLEIAISRTAKVEDAAYSFDAIVNDGATRCTNRSVRVIADDNANVSGTIDSTVTNRAVALRGVDRAWLFSMRGIGCIPNCSSPRQQGEVDNPLRLIVFQRGPWVSVIATNELDVGDDERFIARAQAIVDLLALTA